MDQTPLERPEAGAISASEAQLAAVLESISDGFYALDRNWRYVIFNRAAETYFGTSKDAVLGKVIWDIFPQGKDTPFERCCRLAMDQRVASTFETPSRLRPDRFVELRIAPMADGGVAVSLNDITERRAAAEALRAADARKTEILESISDAFYAVDADWRFTYVNRQAEQWWEREHGSLLGKKLWDEFPQVQGSLSHTHHLKAAAERVVGRFETFSPLIHRWLDVTVHPTADGGLSVYFRDISERKRGEAARDLLMREVDHRARNMLSVVQSIIQLTRARDLAAYKDLVLGRISALARAQASLAQRRWEGGLLSAVIDEELSALGRERARRLSGPDITLTPERVQPLSMILHELGTNARKYGALGVEGGQVEVDWSLAADGQVRLVWRESGGPEVAAPSRRGFGSRLIRDLARQLGGEARFNWRPSGLWVEICAPLGGGEGMVDATGIEPVTPSV